MDVKGVLTYNKRKLTRAVNGIWYGDLLMQYRFSFNTVKMSADMYAYLMAIKNFLKIQKTFNSEPLTITIPHEPTVKILKSDGLKYTAIEPSDKYCLLTLMELYNPVIVYEPLEFPDTLVKEFIREEAGYMKSKKFYDYGLWN